MGRIQTSIAGYYNEYYNSYYSYYQSLYTGNGNYYSYYYNSLSPRSALYFNEYHAFFNSYANYYYNQPTFYDDLPPTAAPNVLISSDPDKVTIKVPGGNGMRLDIEGTNLTTNAKGYLTGGTVSKMKFYNKKSGDATSFEFLIPATAADLKAAAKAGSGPFSPQNFSEFFDLLSPTFLIGTGSKKGDVFSGHTGDDEFTGKGGDDMFFLGVGDDFFNAGKGTDVVNAIDAQSGVTARLGKGTFETDEGTTTTKGVENFLGSKFADKIYGSKAANILFGGNNKDVVFGGKGNDIVGGGKGNDKLKGQAGRDKFVFKPKEGTDRVLDFQDGKDKISFKEFGFKNKKQALKHFYEIGGKNDDKVGFDYKGTKIIIKGADLSDITGADILI